MLACVRSLAVRRSALLRQEAALQTRICCGCVFWVTPVVQVCLILRVAASAREGVPLRHLYSCRLRCTIITRYTRHSNSFTVELPCAGCWLAAVTTIRQWWPRRPGPGTVTAPPHHHHHHGRGEHRIKLDTFRHCTKWIFSILVWQNCFKK